MDELDVIIYAVSVDRKELSQEIKDNGLFFLVDYGATQEDGPSIAAKDRSGYIQPAEFLQRGGGTMLGSIYLSGRMGAYEAIRQTTRREVI